MTLPRLSFRERFRHFHNVLGPASAWVFGVLVMLWLAAVVYLLVTGGPWEKKLLQKLARGTELSWQQYRQLGVGWGMVGLSCTLPAVHYVLAEMGLTYKKRRSELLSKTAQTSASHAASGSTNSLASIPRGSFSSMKAGRRPT